jgi:Zn finger protein HypA/HybF involved in hydrogenase expression
MNYEEDCLCLNCKTYFKEPTGGGACPLCGSSKWTEPTDENYSELCESIAYNM